MNGYQILNIILGIIALALFGNIVYLKIIAKRSATMLSEEAFKAGMRKAQVIDVREKDSFDAGHILGARNIPFSTFKLNYSAIRKDLPVYLYEQKKNLSIRCANRLRKNGYDQVYILKDGYEKWTGKIKKK